MGILNIGTVSSIIGDSVYVSVPAIGSGTPFGPVESPGFDLIAGDRIVVGQLGQVPENVIIICPIELPQERMAVTWFAGPDDPLVGLGKNGDFYVNMTDSNVFEKISDAWILQGNIGGVAGLDGDPGAKWYTETGAPGAGIGVDGDFSLDKVTVVGDVYKKIAGAWVFQVNIRGASGAGTGDALVADPLSQFAATTSAQLAGVMTNETGTGALVFATSPALTTPTGIVKGDVGLGNVNNTSDAAKPVSTATQTELDLKAPIASPTLTGTLTVPLVKITSGVPGVGKVLTSDADGDATWETSASSTNLTQTVTAATVAINSDTGTDVTIAAANGSDAGVMTSAMQVKLAGIATGATVYTNADADARVAAAVGVTVEAYDADLSTIAGLTPSNDDFLQRKGGIWAVRGVNNVRTDLSINNVDNTSNATERAASATLTNKKLLDSTTTISDNTDTTKSIKFDVAGTTFTTGTIATAFTTAKTITIPDATDTLVGKATTDTLTNKTLTSPVVNSPTGIVKADVGLANVDNTSDANKPVSTAQQTALNLKANIAGPTFTGLSTFDTVKITGGIPASGKVLTSDADGDATWETNGAGDALTSQPLSQFAATTSAQLLGVITNETGSGALVFATSPALVTPTGIVKGDVGLGNVDNTSNATERAAAATLTNKALSDSTTTIIDVTDGTKAIKFDVAGTTAITGTIATAFTTAKTLTLPDATDTLVGKATTDTLTNKTLTSPAISTPTGLVKGDVGLGNVANVDQQNASNLTSGTVAPARLGTGSGGSTKFLREDSTFQTIGGGGDALTANPLSQFAATTSLQLKNTISDETGSGALVFATSPALTTPTGIVKGDVGLGNVDNTSNATERAAAAVLTNKTLSDSTTLIVDNTDNTKAVKFDVAGTTGITGTIATAFTTAKTVTIQNVTDTLVGRTTTDTLTNKTLTSPAISTPTGIVKGDVGLGSVDNTSDAAKPVSTATQTALDLKQTLDSDLTTIAGLTATTDNFMVAASSAWASRTPAQAKTSLALVKADVGLGNVDNTSDATKDAAVTTLTNKKLSDSTTTIVDNTDATKILKFDVTGTTGITGTITTAFTTAKTLTLPDATDTLVGKATTDTLTNKTLTSPAISTPTGIVKGDVGLGNVDNTSDATKDAATVTLTNKSLNTNNVMFTGNADPTKKLSFGIGGFTTGTTRTLTVPDADGTAVMRDFTQTLTNKALSDSTTSIVDVTDATKVLKFDVTGTTGITGTILTAFTTAKTITIPNATDTLVGLATTDTLTNKTLTSPAITTPTGIVKGDVGLGNVANVDQQNAANLTSGTVAPARLGTGSGGATKFLREDSTFQTIAGGGDALVANPLSQFAATTSLQLKNTISDETGSGALVFATSPALVTPTGIVKDDVGLGNVDNTSNATERAAAAVLTNKSLSDSTTLIVDNTDNTKAVKFDVAGTTGITGTIATAFTTAKTVTIPDITDTLVGQTALDLKGNVAVVDTFTASGTWTKPANAKAVRVVVIAPGGGGGSGRRGATATIRCAGGSGGGGGVSEYIFPASALGATETVTINTFGTGGAAQTVDSTNGNNGTAGGSCTFGAFAYAAGGLAGQGGTALTGAAAGTTSGRFIGPAGIAASNTGAAGSNGLQGAGSTASGGSGGGITTGNVGSAGGNGAAPPGRNATQATGGAIGANGAAGGAATTGVAQPGGGGAGGGSGVAAGGVGGNGGDGGNYGAGGGSGGGSLNASNSGAGGNGAPGIIVVTTFF